MKPKNQPPLTAAERDRAAFALLEQLAAREGLAHYRELLAGVLPALREAGLERARQEDGELSTAAEREAIAKRAAVAVHQTLLGTLQVPQAPGERG